MLWPRLWRILITASILVGLWWWTGVSADIQTAPSTFIPRSIQVSQLP